MKEFSFDNVKLWEIPYGSKIKLTKEELMENGYKNFNFEKDSYEFIKADRFYSEEEVNLILLDNKMTTASVYHGLIKDKDFEVIEGPTKENLEILYNYYLSQLLFDILEDDFYITEDRKKEIKNKIEQVKLFKEVLKEVE